MKVLSLLICIVLLFSCQEENDYVVEDRLYQCLVEEFESRGIDFNSEIDKLEKSLLKQGVLASSSSKDYITLNSFLNNYSEENSKKFK